MLLISIKLLQQQPERIGFGGKQLTVKLSSTAMCVVKQEKQSWTIISDEKFEQGQSEC